MLTSGSLKIRNYLHDSLCDSGFELVENHISNITRYRKYKPHVITLDLISSQGNRLDELEKITIDYPDAHIIVATGLEINNQPLFPAGIDPVVVENKPFKQSKISEIIKKIERYSTR